jgi:hypothetical protein
MTTYTPDPADVEPMSFHHFDEVVETYARVTSYSYGAGGIGVSIQITLEKDGVVLAVRLPIVPSRDLALAMLAAVDPWLPVPATSPAAAPTSTE